MYQKTVLDNSIRLVTEQLPSRLVSIGIWVAVGARDEDVRNNGSAHFVEHMAFNGSKNFTKNELVSFLEKSGVSFGADLNAYTSFDSTVYYQYFPRIPSVHTWYIQ